MVQGTDYTALSKRQLYVSFALVTSLFFLWGFSYGLLDVLNQHFLTIFNLNKTQTTLLQFAYFVSYLIVAPPMGVLMRKVGYKIGIHIGLGLFSTGAILFWPSAVYAKYGMFVAFTFVAASGLATLEVAANTYIVVLGPPSQAAFRLTFAQSFNGIATVIGPIIAAHAFFNGENATKLDTVQYVYLALALFALILNIGLYFCKLPEINQGVTEEQEEEMKRNGLKGFLKYYHTIFGFVAEFFYVGAQVAVASFAVFYLTKQPGIEPPYSASMASNMFSGCQAVFTVGRFIGVVYLRYVDPAFALFVHGFFLILFSILTATLDGKGGIACLYMIFLFESVCYPVIFSIATSNLGTYVRFGGGLIAMGVSGGACWPTLQGLVADHRSTQLSYLVPFAGFVPLMLYGLVMWVVKCQRHSVYSIWLRDLDGADQSVIEEDLRHHQYTQDAEKKRDDSFEERAVVSN